jgi:hypothetical protein
LAICAMYVSLMATDAANLSFSTTICHTHNFDTPKKWESKGRETGNAMKKKKTR